MILHRHVLTLDEAGFVEALTERGRMARRGFRRPGVDEGNDRHRWLLRARREVPCPRASEQREEIAPRHSISSSAATCNVNGMLKPSVLAVLRLMNNSNFVGCRTGRSEGFSPWRMRPV